MSLDTTPIVEVDAFTATVPKPLVGTDILAEDVIAVEQALANRTLFLDNHKAALSGDEFTGPVTIDSTLDVTGTLTVGDVFHAQVGANIDGVASFGNNVGITGVTTHTGAVVCNGAATFNGTTIVSAAHTFEVQGYDLHPDIIDLNDADHTLDLTTGGQRIRMLTAPAGNRILTLKQTTTSNRPPDKYWFEITVIMNTSNKTVSVIREGSGDTVCVIGDGVGTSPWGSSNLVASVRVVKQGGIWRGSFAGAGPVFHGGDW